MIVAVSLASLALPFAPDPSAGGSAVCTVDDDGGADFTDIQPAVDVAVPGDVILVEPGSYGAFDLDEGGTLCASCRRGRALSPEALELLRLILGGQLREALARPVTAATGEVDHLAADAMEHHLERRLRSLGVLGQG